MRGSHDPRTLRCLIDRFATTAAGNADGRHASTMSIGTSAAAALDKSRSRRSASKRNAWVFGNWSAAFLPENVASLALYRKVGFGEVGVYRRHGKLDGEWRDCVIVEMLLGEATAPESRD